VLIFGAPGVGKTHFAIPLGGAIVEGGHTVLFTSATGLLAALAKAETEGQLAERLLSSTSSTPAAINSDAAACRKSWNRTRGSLGFAASSNREELGRRSACEDRCRPSDPRLVSRTS
jgi:hypothetical protein